MAQVDGQAVPVGNLHVTLAFLGSVPGETIARLIERVEALTGQLPNIDVALATLVARHRLPADAAFALFAVARSVGLLAHSMEQSAVLSVIRPRGRYTGPTEGLQPRAKPGRRKA